jgi:hypothetical protein
MVFLKEIRDKADIYAGDKLALVSWEKDGKVCCFTLIKADDFGDMAKICWAYDEGGHGRRNPVSDRKMPSIKIY